MIRGILPPLTTPFREDGALDVAAFEANLAICQALHPVT